MIRSARGPVDYVMAHRLAVIERRIPFGDALSLSRVYVLHGADAFLVGRRQLITVATAKRLTGGGWLAMETTGELPQFSVKFRALAAPPDVPALPYRLESAVTRSYPGDAVWWARLAEQALDVLDAAWIIAHREASERERARQAPDQSSSGAGWSARREQLELGLQTGEPVQQSLDG